MFVYQRVAKHVFIGWVPFNAIQAGLDIRSSEESPPPIELPPEDVKIVAYSSTGEMVGLGILLESHIYIYIILYHIILYDMYIILYDIHIIWYYIILSFIYIIVYVIILHYIKCALYYIYIISYFIILDHTK